MNNQQKCPVYRYRQAGLASRPWTRHSGICATQGNQPYDCCMVLSIFLINLFYNSRIDFYNILGYATDLNSIRQQQNVEFEVDND